VSRKGINTSVNFPDMSKVTDEKCRSAFIDIIFIIRNLLYDLLNMYDYMPKVAIVEEVKTDSILCILDNKEITVFPIKHSGTNSLAGSVWPSYSKDDKIVVILHEGVYYTTVNFEDTL
jgi:hypothetical protein